jgi:crotonobetainyl-CoA:carnitine CoA-transferase CaiB-like acyl-CoA transferase
VSVEPALPLSGITVLDFSRVLAGPLATQTLGDLGAHIIKVERPEVGDDTRGWGPPFVGDDAAYFFSVNRNKTSLALDLGTDEGIAEAARLADSADVLVENFRPGLMRRFGLDHETLRKRNPGLVYCSLLAFGDDEDESKPGYDIIVQALSGLMSVTGERGRDPVKVGVALLDVITGLYASSGILAALREREATGVGRRITVSLFEASVAAMVNQAANHLLGGLVPGPMGTEHPNIVPYQVFDASDRPFVLAAGNDRLYERTCDVLRRPDLAERYPTNQERVSARAELVPVLQEAFSTRPAAEWLAELEAAAVPCAPVRTLDEVFASPEGAATIQEIRDETRGTLRLVANPIRFDGDHLPACSAPPELDGRPRR